MHSTHATHLNSLLPSVSSEGTGHGSLLSSALASLLTMCLLLMRLCPPCSISLLQNLKHLLSSRARFIKREDVQLLLWGGAISLLPAMLPLGAAYVLAVAAIVLLVFVLLAMLMQCVAITEKLLKGLATRAPWFTQAKSRLIFKTRFISPSLRPPLFTI